MQGFSAEADLLVGSNTVQWVSGCRQAGQGNKGSFLLINILQSCLLVNYVLQAVEVSNVSI